MRLRRVDCHQAGYGRRRHGRGFSYVDERGQRITEPEVLERIQALAIPPAWQDVWICPSPSGHIQAVGTDAAGRRQYLYHPRWRARRERDKFEQSLEFARRLPMLREIVKGHLEREEVDRERVLACAVRLLDRGLFRVGGEEYVEKHGSFGLATLRKRHVSLGDGTVTFRYTAKGGIERHVVIADAAVYTVVQALKRRRGGPEDLLAFRQGGRWRDVRSSDINAYLKEATGEEYSAKTFRTWHATVLAAVTLANADPARSATQRRRVVGAVVKEVAQNLGNTPAICRRSYIDPRVIDRYEQGETIRAALDDLAARGIDEEEELQAAIETEVVALIDEAPPITLAA